MDIIRSSGVRIVIDPLAGAALGFWPPIIERYGIAATVVSNGLDPTFRFKTADWDGQIRMDCSSPYAMTRLIDVGGKFDIGFVNDTDADRHGIVAGASGLMNLNHVLAAGIDYLFANRPTGTRLRRSAKPWSAAAPPTPSPLESAARWSKGGSGSNGSPGACRTAHLCRAVTNQANGASALR